MKNNSAIETKTLTEYVVSVPCATGQEYDDSDVTIEWLERVWAESEEDAIDRVSDSCSYYDLDLAGDCLSFAPMDYWEVGERSQSKKVKEVLQRYQDGERDFSGIDLSYEDLRWENFSGSNFSGANLSNASLEDADFSGVNLSNVDLENANLEGTNLQDAILEGANFQGATYYDSDLANDMFIDRENTSFPKGFEPEDGGLVLIKYEVEEWDDSEDEEDDDY